MKDRVSLRVEPIEVPHDDPFKNDLLGRENFVKAFVSILRTTVKPTVFAINGGWGTGKTTFAEMLLCCLRNDGFKVANVNAWKTDFTGDPLGAIVSALSDNAELRGKGLDEFKEAAVTLMSSVLPAAMRLAVAGLSIPAGLGEAVGELIAQGAESRLAAFKQHARSMEKFQSQLTKLASDRDKPLVFVVDELDRCRPTYAVEMLETIKHAFDAENVLFVLTVNRSQLNQSASILYGSFAETESYFSRFFDVELILPQGNKKSAIQAILESLGAFGSNDPTYLLVEFLSRCPLGIRAIARALRHYAMVYNSTYPAPGHPDWALSTAILLRFTRPDDYRAFIADEVSDADVVDKLFSLGWAKDLKDSREGNLLEGALIAAAKARPQTSARISPSELEARYLNPRASPNQDGQEPSPKKWADVFKQRDGGAFFWRAVETIEMLSGNLNTGGYNTNHS